MAAIVDEKELMKILKELFPQIIFFRDLTNEQQSIKSKSIVNKANLVRLIHKNKINYKDKQALVQGMMTSGIFSILFPPDPKKYKSGPVIKFFINKTNEDFLHGFDKSVDKRVNSNNNPVIDVAELFYKDVFEGKTYFFDEINDPKILNICEHSPSSIYTAFEYYAHKQYTLLRLGREFLINDLYEKWKTELESKLPKSKDKPSDEIRTNNYWALTLYYNNFINIYENVYKEQKGKKPDIALAWDIINGLFINEHIGLLKLKEKEKNNETMKHYNNNLTILYRKIFQVLESTPKKYESRYIPTEFIILAGQISGQLGHKYFGNEELNDNGSEDDDFDSKVDEKINKDKYINDNSYITYAVEDVKIFVDNFLIKEFNTDKDRNFIKTMGKNGEWSSIKSKKELSSINYNESGTLILKLYSGEYENVNKNMFFYKLEKALNEYRRWNKRTQKEGENKNDN